MAESKKKSTELIIEIAQAHDGSLGILHSYIDAVAKAGADTIKFQTHIAKSESSSKEPFRVNFSYVDKTRYDYWKRMEFDFEQWKEIKAHCDEVGINFLSSPFSMAAVEMLEKLDVDTYKIASGEVTNLFMIEEIAKTGKRLLLSSGMSTYDEIDTALERVERHHKNIGIFQCTTSYPTPFDRVGLNVVSEMIEKYSYPIGLSDHSSSIFPPLGAVALGAELIELHGVFSKEMFGPDAKASLTMEEIKQLVEGIKALDAMKNNPVDKDSDQQYIDLKKTFGKSLGVNKDLPAGHIIQRADLETKKPGGEGISASDFESVLGKSLKNALKAQDFINTQDLND